MPDYQNGKIYKLVSGGLTYYGSTTQSLCKRKNGHKEDYKKNNNNKGCISRKIFELGEVDIVLIEKFPCNSKEELHSRERFYIENNECINKQIPTRTPKEWREQNKDKIKEWREQNKDKIKEYYEDNKEKIKEYKEKNKDKIKEKTKEYREKNKDIIKKKNNKYYEENKDIINEKSKEYYEKNKDKIKEWREQYKDRKNELRRLRRLYKKIDKLFYEEL